MRKVKLMSLLSLMFILLTIPLYARDMNTRFDTVKAVYERQTLQIVAGSDIEGYSYLGMLVTRYESKTPNAPLPDTYEKPGQYTQRVEIGGNETFFVPYSQAVGTGNNAKVYNLNFDNEVVRRTLLSTYPELVNDGIAFNNLHEDSRVFALEWYHVYRTPEGRVMAVGKDFEEYNNPYRTFFKVGPQILSISTTTGTYDADTDITLRITFSEPVDINGKLAIKFEGYTPLVEFPNHVSEKSTTHVDGTLRLPSDFPETTRTHVLNQSNLANASAKTEYIVVKGDGEDKFITSTITNMYPQGYAKSVFDSITDTQVKPFVNIGDTFNNAFIFDMSEPIIQLLSMSLTSTDGTALPNQEFDSLGDVVTPTWFNGNLLSILGTYTDTASGPNNLSVLNTAGDLLKRGKIPNSDILSRTTTPPYGIAQDAVVSGQRAMLNLSARDIRDSVTSETLFEGEVVLKAKVEDMAYDNDLVPYHAKTQTFRTFIDLYPPELESATVRNSGEATLKFTTKNSPLKQVDYAWLTSEAYKSAVETGNWNVAPEFYLYMDGYNHGKDSLQDFVEHLVSSNMSYTDMLEKEYSYLPTTSTEYEAVIDLQESFLANGAYLVYRTVDQLGNVGYGHVSMPVISRGYPYLVEIDTPSYNQYFSNLVETGNSVINVRARTIDSSLGEPRTSTDLDNIKQAAVTFSLYKASAPDTPITGIKNVPLGDVTLSGPRWTEFAFDINLRNYVVSDTDLDGELILEINSHHVENSAIKAVSARVPIIVHSEKPSLTYTTSSTVTPGTSLPTLTVNSRANSAIPLYGVYNSVGTSEIIPTFVMESRNANKDWTKIESAHSQILENLNGTIYYRVIAFDMAKNKAIINLGPISMYSDLESYIYSTKQASFVGNKTASSTATLLLSNQVDNSLIHLTRLASPVQLPLLNLGVKLTDTLASKTVVSGSSTSTSLELPFGVKNTVLDYRKYLADFSLSTGVPVNTPLTNRTSEVYTIVNPIQTLYDISLEYDGATLKARMKLKDNLSTLAFANGNSLADIVSNSNSLFGLDLKNSVWINTSGSITETSAVPFTYDTEITLPLGSNDTISIGYRNPNAESPNYELTFLWDSSLANAEIMNVPTTLVQASSTYEIQVRTTHLGTQHTLPANMPQSFVDEYKVNIMIIPVSDGTVNYSVSAKENWTNLESTYAKNYVIDANRKVEKNGKYDILIEVVTPFKIKCYDYKQLNLLLVDKEDYLASENNQSLLISSSTVFNSLNRKIANHSIRVTKASDVGAYQLQNGDIIVYSKVPQLGTNTVIEVYDSNFNLVKQLDATTLGSVAKINDVLQVKNIILLGTNAGLFSIDNGYTTLSQQTITGSGIANTEIYQLERFNNDVLLGIDIEDTLVLVNIDENNLTYNSSRNAMELFGDTSKRVKKLQVRNSSIYVTYDTSLVSAVKYTVLE